MEIIDNSTTDNNDDSPGKTSRPRWGVVLVWVFVLGLLAVLGIGLVRSQRGSIRVGDRVPDLILSTFEGDEIDFADLRGQIVVVNFWASWCKPCEQEAVELEQAYQMYKDQGVVFLGVDYVDTETEARAYLAKFGITYPNGPDLGTRISQAFRTLGVPETYIIGPDGRLAAVKIGPYLSLDEIVNQIEMVMAE
ncbi:MAG: TlpA family protein disulfide reductase [Anaerolineales bacterium]|nr:MAG: TlpA family protein disulfide reductase [Anaerolineales bacterium]